MRGRNDEVAEAAVAGKVVRTNSATFKGAERPVVVLGLDIDPARTDRREEVRRAIHVAAIRARSHLSVVGSPEVADAYGFDQLADHLRGPIHGRNMADRGRRMLDLDPHDIDAPASAV